MTNVVLICVDQWRFDCFSGLNAAASANDLNVPDFKLPVHTPFLDHLAQTGTRCNRAYSPSPTCVPARRSLFTGLSPAHHGIVGYRDGVPLPTETTIAKCFSTAGYQTQAIGKMHVWPERHRAGFDHVILHDGYLHHARAGRRDTRFYDDYTTWLANQNGTNAFTDEYENGVHCNAIMARPWDRPEYQHPTNWATTEAINWLYRRDPNQPFFLFLSYHRPHAPYNPPQWAWDMYDAINPDLYPRGNWENIYLQDWENNLNPQAHVANYPAIIRKRAIQGYFGNITHIDSQIERFVEAINDFGLFEDTIICFTSDHGDMLGEHGMWRKGYPYEGSARVPLFFTGANIKSGQELNDLTDLSDLMPTLLELADVKIPCGLDGKSLASKLHTNYSTTNKQQTNPNHSYLHGEHLVFEQSLQWIITEEYKYIWWSNTGQEQLFALQNDPHELNDLVIHAQKHPQIQAQVDSVLSVLRNQLVEVIKERPEGFVQDSKLKAGHKIL